MLHFSNLLATHSDLVGSHFTPILGVFCTRKQLACLFQFLLMHYSLDLRLSSDNRHQRGLHAAGALCSLLLVQHVRQTPTRTPPPPPLLQEFVELYDKYNSKGLEVIAFPCNQFGELPLALPLLLSPLQLQELDCCSALHVALCIPA